MIIYYDDTIQLPSASVRIRNTYDDVDLVGADSFFQSSDQSHATFSTYFGVGNAGVQSVATFYGTYLLRNYAVAAFNINAKQTITVDVTTSSSLSFYTSAIAIPWIPSYIIWSPSGAARHLLPFAAAVTSSTSNIHSTPVRPITYSVRLPAGSILYAQPNVFFPAGPDTNQQYIDNFPSTSFFASIRIPIDESKNYVSGTSYAAKSE
ncbi:MAG: hypothetical protein E6R05_03250 [Candidatus Moraniibacteriota bacterium]|nr:MAG: hypothetical protein E6R05_03250 [Candidatus Moranbacteria bacterium]